MECHRCPPTLSELLPDHQRLQDRPVKRLRPTRKASPGPDAHTSPGTRRVKVSRTRFVNLRSCSQDKDIQSLKTKTCQDLGQGIQKYSGTDIAVSGTGTWSPGDRTNSSKSPGTNSSKSPGTNSSKSPDMDSSKTR
ncbi:hypothetical protein AVEN_99396-1 [Araneus ventricosus]|uniref:Uncharacterized protein n=1 Tax=Araneus ventricosus TaxID=182803 RepID=A0A4Y1ZXH7_ARAVE|nr:hypothetical protein AVEN_99396-1 [Araneus ventricosus]